MAILLLHMLNPTHGVGSGQKPWLLAEGVWQVEDHDNEGHDEENDVTQDRLHNGVVKRALRGGGVNKGHFDGYLVMSKLSTVKEKVVSHTKL